MHTNDDSGKDEAQQRLHKINKTDHKNQQRYNGEILFNFVPNCFWSGQSKGQDCNRNESPTLQGVTFKRHGEGQNKHRDEHPTEHRGAYDQFERQTNHQKQKNNVFKPEWAVAQKFFVSQRKHDLPRY